MDPAESAAVAAWVAGGAAALFGASGLVLGILGYRRAAQATSAAATSTLAAKEANRIATESNRIAARASELVSAAEARATEQHDVRWRGRWAAAGMYRLTNVGMHDAYQVVAQVHVGNEVVTAEAACVPSGDHIEVGLEQIRPRHWAEELDEAGHRGGGMRIITLGPPEMNTVQERVFWRTAQGAAREHAESRVVYFDPRDAGTG